MRYVYHVCASFDSGRRTIEFDGLSITNLPITTLDSYVSLRQSFRDNYELEKDGFLTIRSLTFLHEIDDEA